jgi:NAD(P)H-hydrate epimerase
MSGSIAMSAMAALRTGAGLVTAAVPDRCLETVAGFHPGIMTVPIPDDDAGRFASDADRQVVKRAQGVSAIGCGPGMTTHGGSIRIVERLLGMTSIPRLLDADGLNSLATLSWAGQRGEIEPGGETEPGRWGPLVLTPHPGELARLTGVAPDDPEGQIAAAKSLAKRTGAVIVVKGGPTVVVAPDLEWTNTTGNPGMATAGSGDVLTGVISALLGQGLSPWDAARLGVWLHGQAGDIAAELHGQAGMTAMEILEALPEAARRVTANEQGSGT